MDKSGFNKMFLIVIGIVVLVVIYRFLTVTPRNAVSLQKLSQQESEIRISDDSDAPNGTTAVSKQESNQTKVDEDGFYDDDKKTRLTEELQPHKYHADPYIEARSIFSEKALCFATHTIALRL